PRFQRRGSALVSVILVLLVLTIVGVGIAYFTSMEDRLSGNTRIAKAGFYAADAGLRRGEALLRKVVNMPTACVPPTLSGLLAARSGAPLRVPGGGYDALVLDFSTFDATALCLGTDAQSYASVLIPAPAAVSVVDRVTYSLYLRNNVDDAEGTDVADKDNIVNLVSVGTVQLAAGVIVTKIVEEQILLTTGGGSTGAQKDVNAGGTNTITGKKK
ncbi:MAG TPA: PilX N-terminal domain-containing pilus assembly protein, partial [Thermoanaerobaculia bacterium]